MRKPLTPKFESCARVGLAVLVPSFFFVGMIIYILQKRDFSLISIVLVIMLFIITTAIFIIGYIINFCLQAEWR